MWTCSKCGERHDDEFDSCWKCAQKEAPSPTDRTSEEEAYALYENGSRLEARGEFPSALTQYEEIVQRFPNTEAARDASKSIDSLRKRTIQ
jgi:outer membrane protein assembly factor BamD (BamD/ComL family)